VKKENEILNPLFDFEELKFPSKFSPKQRFELQKHICVSFQLRKVVIQMTTSIK